MNNSLCPCGSGRLYSRCCALFITASLMPETAEQLMRSRFTAFYFNEHPYLVNTHHPSQREANELTSLQNSQETSHWIKLIIHQVKHGDKQHQTGQVEFSAFFNENNEFFELREKSRFIREQDQWYYLDGEPNIYRTNLKLKRNDLCWCQSGKKFKHCHAL